MSHCNGNQEKKFKKRSKVMFWGYIILIGTLIVLAILSEIYSVFKADMIAFAGLAIFPSITVTRILLIKESDPKIAPAHKNKLVWIMQLLLAIMVMTVWLVSKTDNTKLFVDGVLKGEIIIFLFFAHSAIVLTYYILSKVRSTQKNK